MPVHALPGTPHDAPLPFIVCDKRSDTNRVPVPLRRLERWRASGDSIAAFLADELGLPDHPNEAVSPGRWEFGWFEGARNGGDLALIADEGMTVALGGHSIALADVLVLDGETLRLDTGALVTLLERDTRQPIAEVGSAEQRRRSAKAAADARHDRPGGSREKQERMREIWASGKYTTKERCAEEECAALGISFSTARKALRNAPDPHRPA